MKTVKLKLSGVKSKVRKEYIKRFPLSRAPHPFSLYEKLLVQLKSSYGGYARFILMPEHGQGMAPDSDVRIILRHDLDTDVCLRQSLKIAAIEERYNVRSSWYVRVDEYQYSISDGNEIVAELVRRGQHVGLHAAPYIYTDPLKALREAIVTFEERFGFRPPTFTVHGILSTPIIKKRRAAFLQQLSQSQGGFPFCDSVRHTYDLAMGDAHFTGRGNTYLARNEWQRILNARRGQSILILNHPCYWGKDGIRTSSGSL